MAGSREESQSVTVSLLLLLIQRTPGCKAIYTGYMPTHPGYFAVFIIWESIHSHHKMQHSPAYGPFVQGILPILAGDIEVMHFEITDPKELKKALEMPVTQISQLFVQKGKAAEFLKTYNTAIENVFVGEKYTGMWLGYPYENPYVFGVFVLM